LAILFHIAVVALAVVNALVAGSTWDRGRVGRALDGALAFRHTNVVDQFETGLASVFYIWHTLFIFFLVAHGTQAIIKTVVAGASLDLH
jgi:hypothetical protein